VVPGGEALSLAEQRSGAGQQPGRGGGVGYAVARTVYLSGQPDVFRWTCPRLRRGRERPGPGERSPAEDEQGHTKGC
jgi:hypothetical protein